MTKSKNNDTPGRQFKIAGINFDLKLTSVVVLLTLLPIARQYNHITLWLYEIFPSLSILRHGVIQGYVDYFILYLLVPLFVILFMFRENPAKYGLQIGNWREGLIWTVIYCVIITVVLFVLVPNPDSKLISDVSFKQRLFMLVLSLIALVPWEFFVRGLMLFGLAKKIGPGTAILLQMFFYAILHLGKSQMETLSSMIFAFTFGICAWRTRSVLYPILMHFFTSVLFNLISSGTFS